MKYKFRLVKFGKFFVSHLARGGNFKDTYQNRNSHREVKSPFFERKNVSQRSYSVLDQRSNLQKNEVLFEK
jgi:hypothetical protein